MLKRVLREIESASGPVHLAELSRRLDIDPGALAGMIAFWVRKGRLQDNGATDTACVPTGGHCGPSCGGAVSCAFVAKMPRSYSVKRL